MNCLARRCLSGKVGGGGSGLRNRYGFHCDSVGVSGGFMGIALPEIADSDARFLPGLGVL